MFAAFNTPNRGSNVSSTHVVDPFTFFSATTWNARSSINNGWVVDFEASEEDDEAALSDNASVDFDPSATFEPLKNIFAASLNSALEYKPASTPSHRHMYTPSATPNDNSLLLSKSSFFVSTKYASSPPYPNDFDIFALAPSLILSW